MNIVLSVVGIIISLMVLVILYCFIKNDMELSKQYKSSPVTQGRILKKINDVEVYQYGGTSYSKNENRIRSSNKKYGQYEVEYSINGMIFRGSLISKKKKLKHGDLVEIHYDKNQETGEWEVLSTIYGDRLKRLILSFVLAIPLCIIIIICKERGII
ncbi:MAG: hypothetical protein J6A75_11610 [Lachnospiraceae bacterium]|nr:hypothetical protein [Lachnospiraceae bacterium]